MANEITKTVLMQATIGGEVRINRTRTTNISMNGGATATSALTQLIGVTTWDALSLGSVTSPALLNILNTNATSVTTSYVELALADDGSQKFAKVPSAECQPILPVSGVTYYAKATGADVTIEKLIA